MIFTLQLHLVNSRKLESKKSVQTIVHCTLCNLPGVCMVWSFVVFRAYIFIYLCFVYDDPADALAFWLKNVINVM